MWILSDGPFGVNVTHFYRVLRSRLRGKEIGVCLDVINTPELARPDAKSMSEATHSVMGNVGDLSMFVHHIGSLLEQISKKSLCFLRILGRVQSGAD